jgi:tRNA (guanine-N7-)-methyltransferase
LACGKGEYAIGLARLHPERNFIGIDLKGNRLWVGAKIAQRDQLSNVAFLRTQIDRVAEYFQPGEVEEIWITFPDPQLRWSKLKKRLTHPKFLRLYQQILKPGGKIHLKTDSPDLYVFTKQVVELYQLIVHTDTANLYDSAILSPELEIKTHYESLDIAGSSRIHYLCFTLPEEIGNQELDSLLKEKCRPDGAVD